MSDNRRNIYFKNPPIYDAFQMAIELGIIKASSASERIERLVRNDARKHVAAMKKAGIPVPPELMVK